LHLLPTLWFRHTWSWAGGRETPELREVTDATGISGVHAEHAELGGRWFYSDQTVPVLVTGNETNNERLFGTANDARYVKDGIGRAVVHAELDAVDPSGAGTKAALWRRVSVPAGGQVTLRLRLSPTPPRTGAAGRSVHPAFRDFDEIMELRRAESDE